MRPSRRPRPARPLVELVRERDRVDRLALAPEPERGPIDLRVRFAIEVRRVENLGHRADRRRRDHHRAQDGFLGLEVLGRNRGSDGERRGGHGSPSNSARAAGASPCRRRGQAGRTEHTFESYPQTRTTCPQQGPRRDSGNVRSQREVRPSAHNRVDRSVEDLPGADAPICARSAPLTGALPRRRRVEAAALLELGPARRRPRTPWTRRHPRSRPVQ